MTTLESPPTGFFDASLQAPPEILLIAASTLFAVAGISTVVSLYRKSGKNRRIQKIRQQARMQRGKKERS